MEVSQLEMGVRPPPHLFQYTELPPSNNTRTTRHAVGMTEVITFVNNHVRKDNGVVSKANSGWQLSASKSRLVIIRTEH